MQYVLELVGIEDTGHVKVSRHLFDSVWKAQRKMLLDKFFVTLVECFFLMHPTVTKATISVSCLHLER